jgi:hypothetical protein
VSQIHHYKSKKGQWQPQPSGNTFTARWKNPPEITSYKNHRENLKAYRTEEYECTYLSVMGLLHWGSLFRELLTRVATGCHVSTLAGWITSRAAFEGTPSTSSQSCDTPKSKSQHIIAILHAENIFWLTTDLCMQSYSPDNVWSQSHGTVTVFIPWIIFDKKYRS